ncbi:hypothetical protein N658DRAFT_70591 [Parathielavia hyrcaniae]|uniref:Uncharacterized protein n=1 Tax=Parathielavia hyrcaniae TaxID=113614 RepID=A0AAN6T1Y3_9PEZI|nr:hypothetical protein N658DRAFT_70591 [Parathielavia hyrcaniae]
MLIKAEAGNVFYGEQEVTSVRLNDINTQDGSPREPDIAMLSARYSSDFSRSADPDTPGYLYNAHLVANRLKDAQWSCSPRTLGRGRLVPAPETTPPAQPQASPPATADPHRSSFIDVSRPLFPSEQAAWFMGSPVRTPETSGPSSEAATLWLAAGPRNLALLPRSKPCISCLLVTSLV